MDKLLFFSVLQCCSSLHTLLYPDRKVRSDLIYRPGSVAPSKLDKVMYWNGTATSTSINIDADISSLWPPRKEQFHSALHFLEKNLVKREETLQQIHPSLASPSCQL